MAMLTTNVPSCKACNANRYGNPLLKLKVNVCGHFLCDNCINVLFTRSTAPCPACSVQLKRNQFRDQVYDDPLVEKDIGIRDKLSKVYNLREEDFPSLRAYNDYLEEYEWIVYNLLHDIDVETQNEKIETFKTDNKEKIARNRYTSRGGESHNDYALWEEEERRAKARVAQEKVRELQRRQQRKRQHEEFLDELVSSNASAAEIEAKMLHLQQLELEEERRAQVAALELVPPLTAVPASSLHNKPGSFLSSYNSDKVVAMENSLSADNEGCPPIVFDSRAYVHVPVCHSHLGPSPYEDPQAFQSLLEFALEVSPPTAPGLTFNEQQLFAMNDVTSACWLKQILLLACGGLYHDV